MVNFGSKKAKFWLKYFYFKYLIYIQYKIYFFILLGKIMLYKLGYIQVC